MTDAQPYHSEKKLRDMLYDRPNTRVLEQDWVVIVQAIAGGDQRALHMLYTMAHRIVFAFALRITGDEAAAEQATINAFLDVWRNAVDYAPANAIVLGWVMGQARARAMAQSTARSEHPEPRASMKERLVRRIAEETHSDPIQFDDWQWVEPEWTRVASGIDCKFLASDMEKFRVGMVVRLGAGAAYPPHQHAGEEDLYLLDGELWINGRKYLPGHYSLGAPGTVDSQVWSETGCTCVLITSTNDVLR